MDFHRIHNHVTILISAPHVHLYVFTSSSSSCLFFYSAYILSLYSHGIENNGNEIKKERQTNDSQETWKIKIDLLQNRPVSIIIFQTRILFNLYCSPGSKKLDDSYDKNVNTLTGGLLFRSRTNTFLYYLLCISCLYI